MTPSPAPAPPDAKPPAPDAAARLHSEARILTVLSQFAVMQVVLAATGIVRNKIVAYQLGPAVFGELIQITTVMDTIGTLVIFGMPVAIRRNAARVKTTEERRDLLAAANAFVLALSVVACALSAALLLSGRLLPMVGLANTPVSILAAGILLVGVPLNALRANYMSSLEGILDVKGLALRPIAMLLATVAAVPIVLRFGFVGAAFQYLLLTAFVVVLLGMRLRKIAYAPARVTWNRAWVAQLVPFGVVSVISGFAQSLGVTAVRTSLIRAEGAIANGLLQAPTTLAATMQTVILASVGNISLTAIAGHRDPAQMSAAANRILNVVIPVAASALGLLGLLGRPALTILYSSSFSSAAALFPFLLVGDLILVFGRVVSAPLLATGDRVLWVSLEICYAFARWGFAVLLMERLGMVGVTAGFMFAIMLHTVLALGVYRWRYRMSLDPMHFVRLGVGAVLVGALSSIGSGPATALLGAGALAWSAYTAYYGRKILLPELKARLARRRS